MVTRAVHSAPDSLARLPKQSPFFYQLKSLELCFQPKLTDVLSLKVSHKQLKIREDGRRGREGKDKSLGLTELRARRQKQRTGESQVQDILHFCPVLPSIITLPPSLE